MKKTLPQVLIAIAALLLASCATNSAANPNATNPATQTIDGVDKTLNGVNKVGSAVRNIRMIQGLF